MFLGSPSFRFLDLEVVYPKRAAFAFALRENERSCFALRRDFPEVIQWDMMGTFESCVIVSGGFGVYLSSFKWKNLPV